LKVKGLAINCVDVGFHPSTQATFRTRCSTIHLPDIHGTTILMPENIRSRQIDCDVSQLIFQYTGNEAGLLSIDPHPPWLNDREIPTLIETKANAEGVKITLTEWEKLTPLQRFALIKLTRSQHENNNFLPALIEFGLGS
jgi:Conserved nitrate reductase-associated protein (Nitr_red_assoc)